jgi:hypothetical protein
MFAQEGILPEPVTYVGTISNEEIERVEREDDAPSGHDE